MGTGAITAYVDVAQLVLYAFWIFFFGLIYYLIRENHREGYPMDSDRGRPPEGWPRAPEPKTYLLADGRELLAPRDEAPEVIVNAERVYRGAGSPIEPTGDPLAAGVGPGAWSTQRPDEVDLDHHGEPKIVPLALSGGFGVSERDPDPRGMTLYDAAGDAAGTVRELWIDRGEMSFRYLEAEVANGAGGTRRVLVPVTFARITRDGVAVHALYAEQFAGVPAPRASDRLTLMEEERITAYYGAGMLYADDSRTEPLV
jgi:photosynthetic reaction center H subunit